MASSMKDLVNGKNNKEKRTGCGLYLDNDFKSLTFLTAELASAVD